VPVVPIVKKVRQLRVRRFVAISALLFTSVVSFQNCGKFDTRTPASFSSASPNSDLIAQGKILYVQNCASCHGEISSSSKRSRSSSLISLAIGTRPEMAALSFLSSAQIDAIAAALGENSTPTGVDGRGRLSFVCEPGSQPRTPLLKLTNREFRNSVFNLLDDFATSLKSDSQLVALFNALPADTLPQDRNTLKEQPMLITQLMNEAYFEAAFRAGALIAGNATGLQNYPGTSGCLGSATLTEACHQSFVRQLASRAFRKRITTAEGNALATQLWDASLSKAQSLQLTFTSIVQRPEFLYKAYDSGTQSELGQNVINLTAHEVAAKMSFLITGSLPDATLRGLADSGALLDPTTLSAQVDRLLALPAAQDMVRRLFRESYGYDVYDSFNFPAGVLNGLNTSGLQNAMTTELDRYFVHVVLNRRGSFHELMTSRDAEITAANLATIYGLGTAPTGVTVLPANRAGFLSRAAMLSKRSGYHASPIKRGLKVLEHVLCENVGAPPPDAPTTLPDVGDQILSTRHRTELTTEASGTSCLSCHASINRLGYPFEGFDNLGRARSTESIFNQSGQIIGAFPVETRSTTTSLSGSPVSVNDSADFGDQLGRSDRAMMCLVKHLKRFESRVSLSAADNCQMNSSLNALYGNDGTQGAIINAVKSLILSDEFKRWSY